MRLKQNAICKIWVLFVPEICSFVERQVIETDVFTRTVAVVWRISIPRLPVAYLFRNDPDSIPHLL